MTISKRLCAALLALLCLVGTVSCGQKQKESEFAYLFTDGQEETYSIYERCLTVLPVSYSSDLQDAAQTLAEQIGQRLETPCEVISCEQIGTKREEGVCYVLLGEQAQEESRSF